MGSILLARAYANNEVAYVAWDIDEKIDGCLGFEVVRVYLNADGTIQKRPDGTDDKVSCATWVAFKGQRNPYWLPQSTSVWPIQKLAWRDLTLRKKRDQATRRPDEVWVRYEIRPVGDLRPGLEPAPDAAAATVEVTKRDGFGRPVRDPAGKPVKIPAKAYEGKTRPLGYLAPATETNTIHVTRKRGAFHSTFTNGILSGQWLKNVLLEDGVKQPNELMDLISDPASGIRKLWKGVQIGTSPFSLIA